MKSVRACVWLATAIVLVVPLSAQEVEIVSGRKAVAHEVLVKFRSGASQRLRAVIGRQYGIQSMRELNGAGVVHMRSASQSTAHLIQQLSADPDVLYAEPNYIVNMMDAPTTARPTIPTSRRNGVSRMSAITAAFRTRTSMRRRRGPSPPDRRA